MVNSRGYLNTINHREPGALNDTLHHDGCHFLAYNPHTLRHSSVMVNALSTSIACRCERQTMTPETITGSYSICVYDGSSTPDCVLDESRRPPKV